MNPTFCRYWSRMSEEPHFRQSLRITQALTGIFLIYRASTEFKFTRFFYGAEGLGHGQFSMKWGPAGALADRIFDLHFGAHFLVVLMAICGIMLAIGWRTRLASILALLVFSLLSTRLPELGDGGDNIARLTLFYMCFSLPSTSPARKGSFATFIHNASIFAMMAQTSLLYFTSGLMKIRGDLWTQGTALYYITQVDWFSKGNVHEIFKIPVVTFLGSYGAMLLQILFPIAMLTPLRPLWLAAGISMHIGIAHVMGLVSFSLIMIGLEMLFVTDREWERMSLSARRATARTRKAMLILGQYSRNRGRLTATSTRSEQA